MDGFAYTHLQLAYEAKTAPEIAFRPKQGYSIALAFILAGFVPPEHHGFRVTAASVPPPQKIVRTGGTVALQNQLKALGYFPASVKSSGYYGPITRDAVRRFQAAWGLKADGVVGTRTRAALKAAQTYAVAVANGANVMSSTRVWKKGEAGQFVRQTKQRLNDFGYTAGNPESFSGEFFDTRMENAVKRFQKDKGLVADGFIGSKTRQILYAFEYGLPTVKLGDTGSLVQMVQYQLGMVPIGDFDSITEEKVKVFQAEQELEVTGVVDEQTHRVLGTHRARLMLAAMD